MKLKNKKTGEIGKILKQLSEDNQIEVITDNKLYVVKSLAELSAEWEDVPEEPKEHWAIDQFGEPINVSGLSRLQLEKLHRLGNDFPSENATIKVIEKLKAWKRLKDKGFRFTAWYGGSKNISYEITSLENETYIPRQICDDLDMLFSQEDD